MTRIVITDCDHPSIDQEREVASAAGVDLALAQCATEAEVIAAAQGAEGLIVQYAPITRAVMEALPQLKVVSRYGVGVDTVDVDAAAALGVAVCNVPDYGTEDVSDHAIALTVALTRGVARLDRHMRSGGRDLAPAGPLHRNAAQVFGVLGMGEIGAATARKASGLGFSVIGADPRFEPGTTVNGVRVVSQEELFASADVLSLHIPLIPATAHLMNAERLATLKPGAVLINTCRGGVVDTEALIASLESGHLSGAGLDVFEAEPLAQDHPLLSREDVVLTPHAAWYSEESFAELKTRTADHAARIVTGAPALHVLNGATGVRAGATA
jgi:D-3-phosphoglycerate dehydrogenase / 2-oxoglutarate reductase